MNDTGVLIFLSLVMFVSLGFYFVKLSLYRDNEKGRQILGYASQWMYSSFILGFGIFMIFLNIFGMGRSKFVASLLMYGTFVSVVNMVSILYYEWKAKRNQF